MRFLSLLSLVLLIACNAPSGYFRASPVTRIAVNGSVFDIRARGTLAEAVRVNPQYAPRLGPIRTRAGIAMALVTGCSVTRILGDQAQILGRLNCPTRGVRPLRVREACRRIDSDGAGIARYHCTGEGPVDEPAKPRPESSIYWG